MKLPASLKTFGVSCVDLYDGWLELELMTLVWLVAQFTIILGPPATFGLYYAVNSMVNGESIGVRGMIAGAKMYFGKSLLWGLINIVFIGLTSLNLWFYGNLKTGVSPILWGIIFVMGITWFTMQFYALPFFFEMEKKQVLLAMKNGLFLALATPFYTFVLMLFAALAVALCVVLVLPIFLSVPALIPLLGTRGIMDRLVSLGIRKPELDPKEVG